MSKVHIEEPIRGDIRETILGGNWRTYCGLEIVKDGVDWLMASWIVGCKEDDSLCKRCKVSYNLRYKKEGG